MLQYEGKVTVNIRNQFDEIIRQGKIKNEGKIFLLSYLTNCLANKIYDNKRPAYITVLYNETGYDDNGYHSLFPLYNAPIKGEVVDDTTEVNNPKSTAVLTSILKGEYLAIHMNTSTAEYYYKFVVLDTDLNIMAQCPCEGDFDIPGPGILASLNSSNSAEVVWEMLLKNKP